MEENIESKDGEQEVELLEFALDEDEINDLMLKLSELKRTKTSFEFEIDEGNELLIHYEETGGKHNSEEENESSVE